MTVHEPTLSRVRRFFRGRRGITEKHMIGGVCFLLNGSMCCGVNGDGLLVRVGPDAIERVLARRHVRPMAFGGRRLKAFVLVEPAGCRSEAALAAWIERGVAFAAAVPGSTKSAPARGGARARKKSR